MNQVIIVVAVPDPTADWPLQPSPKPVPLEEQGDARLAGPSCNNNKQIIAIMGWFSSLLSGAQEEAGPGEALQSVGAIHLGRGDKDIDSINRGEATEGPSTGQLLKKEFGFHDSCELGHGRLRDKRPLEGSRTCHPHASAPPQAAPPRDQLQQQRLIQREQARQERRLRQRKKGHTSRTDGRQTGQREQMRKDSAESTPIVVASLCKGLDFATAAPQPEKSGRPSLSQAQTRLANELSSCLRDLQADVATLARELSELLDPL